MRPVWRGAISFGLVTIAVRMFGSTEEHDFRFHQVHPEDGGRIRYKRVCEICGNEVEYRDIAKGYELEDGRVVILTDEDFEKLPVSTDKSIQVLEFVPTEEVDPIFFQKTYYLDPDKTAGRPYVLLRQALEDTDRHALVKITVRQRESLGILRARDDVLVLHTIFWPDEIRKPDFGFLDQDLEVRPQELKMATSLIDNMSGSFKPEQFTDEYRDAMAELVTAKADGAELPERPEEEDTGDVIDLMTALERSVEQTRAKTAAEQPPKKKRASKSKSA
ncbi:Ku protein [Kibdelosporangium phytohabitans]|uniref:Non-homologous end joining protein Ku n=1 Tax=Kibdelosporangium phytohabitans TaxID=860235 RepID=A0A0N9HVR7_9PSEU|nr:Ku protein [Kibdelosporangium phytohabitans]ALG11480.1 DNA repair protein [Kibdelosporangium phytohabitans]MBE1462828.1 DNA end-binding protein Ku [Kibdelosporangium phytohabitans]